MQLHEKKGKHGAPVTCGDWLFDNRLGLASGLRVKISQPIAETASKWESYSKFKLGGMLSRVPRHIRVAGDPNRLAFTLNYPPFVAVSVGDKYLLTFDTTRVNEDLGLTFPEDYGVIAAFQWLPNLVLLVGLTNGCARIAPHGRRGLPIPTPRPSPHQATWATRRSFTGPRWNGKSSRYVRVARHHAVLGPTLSTLRLRKQAGGRRIAIAVGDA